MNDEKEKKKKAGNPILILGIFLCLILFIFIVPDLYQKYNSEIASVLGIGNNSKTDETQQTEQEDIDATSDYYQIGSQSTLSFNEITLSDIYLENNTLYFTVSSDEEIDLSTVGYYLEFYESKQTFIGRRTLKGTVNGSLDVSIDVSNLDVTTTTYFIVSHIDDNVIGSYELETDESGLGEIICTNNNLEYTYEFYLNDLTKVTEKYTYTNFDLDAYSDELLSYQKLSKSYSDLNGITTSIAENTSTFIFIAEFDYTNITEFTTVSDDYIFKKDTGANVVKFKMDAEGFDCL